MNHSLNTRERELAKAANQFKKRAQQLMQAGKLDPAHQTVSDACDRLLEQVYTHAENRTLILLQYENLKKTVQDNARCPKCGSSTHLKLRGTDANEKGWKMNRYRCRRCHLEFTWNRPNNPWDMLRFFEDLIGQLDRLTTAAPEGAANPEETAQMKAHLQASLAQLKPVVESADQNLRDIRQKDEEMAQLLHEFKNYLLIEKIKLDTWENQAKG